ncbi:MAG: hypothetical protein HUK03_00080 [Bacteroidaceae bacterium]|nr:hypothetical protein [Bacteroidaceae bacterium]
MAVCQIPQAWSVYRTRNTSGISILMQSILTLGVFLWMVSGFLLCANDFYSGLPMVLTNGLCFVFSLYILVVCVSNRSK